MRRGIRRENPRTKPPPPPLLLEIISSRLCADRAVSRGFRRNAIRKETLKKKKKKEHTR